MQAAAVVAMQQRTQQTKQLDGMSNKGREMGLGLAMLLGC